MPSDRPWLSARDPIGWVSELNFTTSGHEKASRNLPRSLAEVPWTSPEARVSKIETELQYLVPPPSSRYRLDSAKQPPKKERLFLSTCIRSISDRQRAGAPQVRRFKPIAS